MAHLKRCSLRKDGTSNAVKTCVARKVGPARQSMGADGVAWLEAAAILSDVFRSCDVRLDDLIFGLTGRSCARQVHCHHMALARPRRSAASTSLAPQTKPTLSVEEWEAKAPLNDVETRSIAEIKSASEHVPLPSKVSEHVCQVRIVSLILISLL